MKIPYLRHKKLKNGEIAYYFDIPKHIMPAGCELKHSYPLGKNYVLACREALNLFERLENFRKSGENIQPKSLAHIWSIYKESRLFKSIKKSTARTYQYTFDILSKLKSGKSGRSFKDVPLDSFDYDSAYNLYEKFVICFKKTQAMYCITVLKMLYNFGFNKGIFTKNNPFANLRIKKNKPKKFVIPHEHVKSIIDKARELGKDNDSYLAVALATELNFYIAQRNADVLKLQDKDIYKKGDNYFFNINQNKVDNVNVKVPIPPHLVEEVLSKKGYIIADRFGKFDVQRFSRYFKKIRDILGFDERYIFKNMRHTRSTAYVEAGVATNAIISITGHTNEAIFNQVYKGNTEEVTLPALKKRLEAESRNNKIKESE